MKPSSAVKKLATLLLMALAIALASCGHREEPSQANSPDASVANVPKSPVDPATAGSVKGTVSLIGAPPRMRAIHMNAVPECALQHSSPPASEEIVLGDNNALQNVVVYLQGDFTPYSFEKPATPAQIDQQGCMYIPHVLAVMAGTPIQFITSDNTSHNIHAVPRNNREWNESQPAKAAPIEQTFAREEIAIPIKCNVHPWMRAYIAVLGHPYFQVTGKDGGFDLKNVPPGTYTLTAWHEFYGTKTQRITVSPGQEQSLPIAFGR